MPNTEVMPPNNTRPRSPMAAYRARKDKGFPPASSRCTRMLIAERVKVTDKYTIIGFISSGTYGRVFKAKSRLVSVPFQGGRLIVDGMEESLRLRSLSLIRRARRLLII